MAPTFKRTPPPSDDRQDDIDAPAPPTEKSSGFGKPASNSNKPKTPKTAPTDAVSSAPMETPTQAGAPTTTPLQSQETPIAVTVESAPILEPIPTTTRFDKAPKRPTYREFPTQAEQDEIWTLALDQAIASGNELPTEATDLHKKAYGQFFYEMVLDEEARETLRRNVAVYNFERAEYSLPATAKRTDGYVPTDPGLDGTTYYALDKRLNGKNRFETLPAPMMQKVLHDALRVGVDRKALPPTFLTDTLDSNKLGAALACYTYVLDDKERDALRIKHGYNTTDTDRMEKKLPPDARKSAVFLTPTIHADCIIDEFKPHKDNGGYLVNIAHAPLYRNGEQVFAHNQIELNSLASDISLKWAAHLKNNKLAENSSTGEFSSLDDNQPLKSRNLEDAINELGEIRFAKAQAATESLAQQLAQQQDLKEQQDQDLLDRLESAQSGNAPDLPERSLEISDLPPEKKVVRDDKPITTPEPIPEPTPEPARRSLFERITNKEPAPSITTTVFCNDDKQAAELRAKKVVEIQQWKRDPSKPIRKDLPAGLSDIVTKVVHDTKKECTRYHMEKGNNFEDFGDRLQFNGAINDRWAGDIVRFSLATKGWNSINLKGTESFKQAIALHCLLSEPQIKVNGYKLPPVLQAAVDKTIATRQAQERAVTAAATADVKNKDNDADAIRDAIRVLRTEDKSLIRKYGDKLIEAARIADLTKRAETQTAPETTLAP